MIADEATDVNNREQLNLSIRYIDDDYVVHEDPIGLCSLPNTFAETVYSVLKDLLLRCDLSLKLCRGQAYLRWSFCDARDQKWSCYED